jgi:hypothetical protein
MDNLRKLGLTGAVLVVFGINLFIMVYLIWIFTGLSYLRVLYISGIYVSLAGGGILVLWLIIWLVLNGQLGKRKEVEPWKMSGFETGEQIPVIVLSRVAPHPATIVFVNDRIKLTVEWPPIVQTFRPKEFVRKDSRTLTINSGFLNYRRLTLKFDSEEDASKVELKLREILPG